MATMSFRCVVYALLIGLAARHSDAIVNPYKPPRGGNVANPPPGNLQSPPPAVPPDGPNLYLQGLRELVRQKITDATLTDHPLEPDDIDEVGTEIVDTLESQYTECRWAATVWTEPTDQALGVYHGLASRQDCNVAVPSNECAFETGGAIIEYETVDEGDILVAVYFVPRTDASWAAAFGPPVDESVMQLRQLLANYYRLLVNLISESLRGRNFPSEVTLTQVAQNVMSGFQSRGVVAPRALVIVYAQAVFQALPEGHLIATTLPISFRAGENRVKLLATLLPPTLQEVHGSLAPGAG